MKKLLTIAVLGGLFAAGTLQAQVNIYISGSTAFRANAYRAIKAAFDGATWTSINPASAGTGTGVWTAQGTMSSLFPSQTVTIYCSYNGSVQGLGNLALNQNVTFTNITPGGAAVSQVPTITFSDADKVATLFPSAPVTETHIAVLPFVYCRNYYGTITNVDSHGLQSLWDNGAIALSMFTGKSSDSNSLMYVTGRNLDSGTRVCASANAFYTGTPTYYGFQSGVFTILNQNLSGALYGPGYASGGNEAQAMTNQLAAGPMVGYLGMNDALSVAGSASSGAGQNNGGGQCSIIAYEGSLPFNNYVPGVTALVPANPDYSPVTQGKYNFWSYECLEMLNTHTADNVYKYYTNMVSAIDADIALSIANSGNSALYGPVTAIRLNDMHVQRASVGGEITPK